MTISRLQQFNRQLERETILDTAPPALREKLEWIQSWFVEDWKRSIVGRYQISAIISEIYNDVNENNGRRYGANAVKMIKQYFGWDEGVIYQALQVADSFTLAEIEAIAQLRFPNGKPVTYTHLTHLAEVEDDTTRQKLLDQTVKKGLTCTGLARAIHAVTPANPNREVERRGRPLAVPKDFDAVLDQQAHFAEDFLNRNEQVWTHSSHSLSAQAAELHTADFTPERAERLKKHAEQMNLLAQKAKDRAEETTCIHALFEQVLQQQTAKHKKLGSTAKSGRTDPTA
jgi:hypothetical protein